MLVLDTAFIVDALHGDKDALSWLSEMEMEKEALCTTSLNVLELFKGAYRSKKTDENIIDVQKFIEQLLVLPIIEDTYDIYGAISSELFLKGEPIGDFDEVIAAIALSYGATIVTRDRHFERIPTLKIMRY